MRDLNLTYESHSGASENLLLSSDRVTRHNNLERLSDDEAEERLLHVPKWILQAFNYSACHNL